MTEKAQEEPNTEPDIIEIRPSEDTEDIPRPA